MEVWKPILDDQVQDRYAVSTLVSNLKWSTRSANTRDGVSEGRINSRKRGPTNRLTGHQVCTIAVQSSKGFGVNEIALQLGFSRTTISSVFNGRSNWGLFSFTRDEISR